MYAWLAAELNRNISVHFRLIILGISAFQELGLTLAVFSFVAGCYADEIDPEQFAVTVTAGLVVIILNMAVYVCWDKLGLRAMPTIYPELLILFVLPKMADRNDLREGGYSKAVEVLDCSLQQTFAVADARFF